MGAKASTPANSGHQSPRTRTFSSSSSTEVASPPGSGAGFNVLRALPGIQVPQNDRQRARSLSSVPDLHQSSAGGGGGSGSGNNTGIGANNNNNSGGSHNHHHHHHHHHPHLVGHNDRNALINRGGSSSTAAVVVSSGTSGAIGPGDRIIYGGHSILLNGGTTGGAISLEQVEEAGLVDGIAASVASSASTTGAMGRVYTATSLPSHIWSLNGIKCPVCSKFVLPDDIECHLVMCLTKPRLSYNEDVLTDAKGECVICLEELNPGDVIARLPCLCVYHKGCIDRWFEVNRSCPEHPGD